MRSGHHGYTWLSKPWDHLIDLKTGLKGLFPIRFEKIQLV